MNGQAANPPKIIFIILMAFLSFLIPIKAKIVPTSDNIAKSVVIIVKTTPLRARAIPLINKPTRYDSSADAGVDTKETTIITIPPIMDMMETAIIIASANVTRIPTTPARI